MTVYELYHVIGGVSGVIALMCGLWLVADRIRAKRRALKLDALTRPPSWRNKK